MVDFIKEKEQVSVSELVERFNVSDMTIRRDLDFLEKLGIIQRIHGGAVYIDENVNDIPLSVRTTENKDLKEKIAQRAIQFIKNDTYILLDAGSTTFEIASLITKMDNLKRLTVITNDINIGYLLSNYDHLHLIMPGGELRYSTKSFVGPKTIDFLKRLNIDQAFIGCSGISYKNGVLMNSNFDEADVKSAMIYASSEVILVADHSKFNKKSLVSFAKIDQLDRIITNDCLTNDLKSWLASFKSLKVDYV